MKFCSYYIISYSSLSRPILGLYKTIVCPMVLKRRSPPAVIPGETVEAMVCFPKSCTFESNGKKAKIFSYFNSVLFLQILDISDPDRVVVGLQTGVLATISTYGEQVNVFLEFEEKIVLIECPLKLPDADGEVSIAANEAGDTNRLSRLDCSVENKEAMKDDVYINNIEYEELGRPEKRLLIYIVQPECGHKNHLYGCTKCRDHISGQSNPVKKKNLRKKTAKKKAKKAEKKKNARKKPI